MVRSALPQSPSCGQHSTLSGPSPSRPTDGLGFREHFFRRPKVRHEEPTPNEAPSRLGLCSRQLFYRHSCGKWYLITCSSELLIKDGTYICLPEKISRCCCGGMPSFSSTRSLMRSTLSVGSMSISISLPVSV